MLRTQELTKRFGDLEVLRDISVSIADGEFVSPRRTERLWQDDDDSLHVFYETADVGARHSLGLGIRPGRGRGSTLKFLARKPLVHFLLLGLALFLVDAWLRPVAAPDRNADIVVSEARIRSLARNFDRAWRRPPTREELDALVKSHVREEVMIREALALGRDRDDAIIRRRLQQKMEFVSEEAAALAPPTDDELNAYLNANADAFRIEPRATFAQVYLDPRKHVATLDADAKRLLQALNAPGTAPAFAKAGDTPMLLDAHYENAPGPGSYLP